DIARAKQLLADAGYPDGAGFPELTYTYPSGGKNGDVAVALQSQLLANLGISIKLQALDPGSYYPARRSGDFELLRYSWTADYTDPVNYLSLFVSGINSAGIADPVYDEFVDKSSREGDAMTRNGLLHDAEEVLVTKQFYVNPLYTQFYIQLVNPKLTGITKDDSGANVYRYADLTE
ncbi:MAG: ABC transporter substrate-binding protein, partial [Oscillospiraceae bacterium]|nr:ABC transporter substrate-binding protein [Oscillospiraceae bacterium]